MSNLPPTKKNDGKFAKKPGMIPGSKMRLVDAAEVRNYINTMTGKHDMFNTALRLNALEDLRSALNTKVALSIPKMLGNTSVSDPKDAPMFVREEKVTEMLEAKGIVASKNTIRPVVHKINKRVQSALTCFVNHELVKLDHADVGPSTLADPNGVRRYVSESDYQDITKLDVAEAIHQCWDRANGKFVSTTKRNNSIENQHKRATSMAANIEKGQNQ